MSVLAIALITLGALLIVGQPCAVVAATRAGRGYSCVPPIGAVLACIGLALLGAPGWTCAIPFALDLGTYAVVFGLPFLLRELWRSR